MSIGSLPPAAFDALQSRTPGLRLPGPKSPGLQSPGLQSPDVAGEKDAAFREAFDSFVGEVFFGQMLKAMRKTVGKPAYFHGGQTEEIFQQQLDQVLGEKLAKTSAGKFSGPMFELMHLTRK